jgi:hypothetical protein
MHRKRLNISTVLAGQRLGIKEVDDGIWIVSFMHYDLGFIDLEQKTLQPLDNPFGIADTQLTRASILLGFRFYIAEIRSLRAMFAAEQFHARIAPNNAMTLSRIDWL